MSRIGRLQESGEDFHAVLAGTGVVNKVARRLLVSLVNEGFQEYC